MTVIFKTKRSQDSSYSVGRTIKVNINTQDTVHVKFTHVCVEMDHGKLLLPSVTLYGRKQQVEYEGLHQICFKCG